MHRQNIKKRTHTPETERKNKTADKSANTKYANYDVIKIAFKLTFKALTQNSPGFRFGSPDRCVSVSESRSFGIGNYMSVRKSVAWLEIVCSSIPKTDVCASKITFLTKATDFAQPHRNINQYANNTVHSNRHALIAMKFQQTNKHLVCVLV